VQEIRHGTLLLRSSSQIEQLLNWLTKNANVYPTNEKMQMSILPRMIAAAIATLRRSYSAEAVGKSNGFRGKLARAE
jgi:hypothetical protein